MQDQQVYLIAAILLVLLTILAILLYKRKLQSQRLSKLKTAINRYIATKRNQVIFKKASTQEHIQSARSNLSNEDVRLQDGFSSIFQQTHLDETNKQSTLDDWSVDNQQQETNHKVQFAQAFQKTQEKTINMVGKNKGRNMMGHKKRLADRAKVYKEDSHSTKQTEQTPKDSQQREQQTHPNRQQLHESIPSQDDIAIQ